MAMSYSQVYDMIQTAHIPAAYYQFTKQTAVEPPFICFYFESDDDMIADNTNYQKIGNLVIELYTAAKDRIAEFTVEQMLKYNDLVYTRSEEAIDSEQLYMVVFRTSIVIAEEVK